MINRADLLRLLSFKRKSRRRLLIIYWIVALSLITLMAALLRRSNFLETFNPYWLGAAVVTLPQLLRAIRSDLTKPIAPISVLALEPAKPDRKSENRSMDERDRYLDTKMTSRAYYYLYLFVPSLVLFLTFLENRNYRGQTYLRIPLLWLLWVLVSSLPKSLILWNEPDMESDD